MGQIVSDFIHSNVKWVNLKTKIPEDVDVLFVFGVKDDSLYRSLSSWLKKKDSHYLVFIEDNEQRFFNSKKSFQMRDSKIRLFYWKKGEEEIFQQIAWEFVFLDFGYVALEADDFKLSQTFFFQLEHYRRGVNLLASDCQDMGVKVLSNAWRNLHYLSFSKLGTTLEGKCAGMPAIICGAGPSLNHSISTLAQLKDRAIIIAGGSAIRALNAQGIQPHLCGSIDPDPPSERFFAQDHFEIPFFYQGRVSSECLAVVHGPLLWMPAAGNYPLEGWLAAECGIFTEPFDSGWTVSNFCTALAVHLGCSKIILVGMDFSCGPNEIYASHLLGEENQPELIELEKGQLYSKQDWLMSVEWMGTFAQHHPHIHWMNATHHGIKIPGIEYRDLSDIAQNLLLEEWDVQGTVQTLALGAEDPQVTFIKVKEVRRKVKESFEKALSLCERLLKIWEKHYPHSPLEKGEYIVLDIELEQEMCHRYFLQPLWEIWKRPILRTSFHPLGQYVHRLLFFKKAIEMHLPLLRSTS